MWDQAANYFHQSTAFAAEISQDEIDKFNPGPFGSCIPHASTSNIKGSVRTEIANKDADDIQYLTEAGSSRRQPRLPDRGQQ